VVEATVGAAERRADIELEWNIVRKTFQIERVWLVEVKNGQDRKMRKVDFRDRVRDRLFDDLSLQSIGGWTRSYA